MTKLDVAIKLVKMLNERRTINSKIIADELNVSLRTAQRYIKELSALPCFIPDGNKNCYELLPNYKFKDALLNSSIFEIIFKKLNIDYRSTNVNQVYCFVCGVNKFDIIHCLIAFDEKDIVDKCKYDQLATTIRTMFKDCNNISTDNSCS